MLGAQRRIEARIGQLLGPPPGRGGKEKNDHGHSFYERFRDEARLLARALSGEYELTVDEWRKSRRALVSLIRNRLGLDGVDSAPSVTTPRAHQSETAPLHARPSLAINKDWVRALARAD